MHGARTFGVYVPGADGQSVDFAVRVAADTRTTADRREPLLVFLPGLGASSGVWHKVRSLMRVPYVMLEPAGCGYDQDPARYGITIEEAARDVVASGVLGGQKLILVGHSAGFVMALAIAKALPEGQVLQIIGVCGLLDHLSELLMWPVWGALRHPRRWFRFRMLMWGLTGRWPDFITKRLRRPKHPFTLLYWPMVWRPWRLTAEDLAYLLDGNRAPGVREFVHANRQHDFGAQAVYVRCPVHLLEGQRDPLATKSARSQFLKRLRRARSGPCTVTVVSWAGHLLPLEAPGVVASWLAVIRDELQTDRDELHER